VFEVRYRSPKPRQRRGFANPQNVGLNWIYLIKPTSLIKDRGDRIRELKIIVEKHPEGYVAYPLGLKGVVIGEGDTYENVLEDVKSAIKFHIETFREEIFETEEIMETFVAEVVV